MCPFWMYTEFMYLCKNVLFLLDKLSATGGQLNNILHHVILYRLFC